MVFVISMDLPLEKQRCFDEYDSKYQLAVANPDNVNIQIEYMTLMVSFTTISTFGTLSVVSEERYNEMVKQIFLKNLDYTVYNRIWH